jgi:type I restriction enzyme S subunit
MTGSAGQKRVPTAFLAEYEFWLPQLSEQRRIAAILDKADNLRRKRQEAIRLADEFLRAVFIDMFGDPAANSKSLPTKRIEELCLVATGATPSRDRPDFFGGQHPWVKTGEVDCPMILTTEERISDSAIRETNCKLFPMRTLLVAMYGQGKTRGKVGMLGIPAATNQACAAILPSASISPYFLYAQLGLMYEHLRAMGRGGNQENLNLGMIKSLEVLVPPKEDIERFLSIRGRADGMLMKARRAQEDAELLTSSLTSSLLG